MVALSSITVRLKRQPQADGLLHYLSKHGQHVRKLDATGDYNQYINPISLRELPSNMPLDNLQLTSNLAVQLQPGSGFQGMVRPGVPLKQLKVSHCKVLDGGEGLAAALDMLPGLQHFSIDDSKRQTEPTVNFRHRHWTGFSVSMLGALQQLTLLEVDDTQLRGPGHPPILVPDLQPLHSLTRLVDLRLSLSVPAPINSSVLSGMQHLTGLKVYLAAELGPGALAAVTQLLCLQVSVAPSAGGTVQWLFQLHYLQQLTMLGVFWHQMDRR